MPFPTFIPLVELRSPVTPCEGLNVSTEQPSQSEPELSLHSTTRIVKRCSSAMDRRRVGLSWPRRLAGQDTGIAICLPVVLVCLCSPMIYFKTELHVARQVKRQSRTFVPHVATPTL
uniref:Uncharacterized protein n=1 Tax=Hyaloperonospora arabidopsidis (strain Emoy2) TaxID=559515 RepID=M4BBZ2_HYAAE